MTPSYTNLLVQCSRPVLMSAERFRAWLTSLTKLERMVSASQTNYLRLLTLITDGVDFRLSFYAEYLQSMPNKVYFDLLRHLQLRNPAAQFHSHIAANPPVSSILLPTEAMVFNHATISGWRYRSSARTPGTSDCLVAIRSSADLAAPLHLAELVHIVSSPDPVRKGSYLTFGHVRWFISSDVDVRGTVWEL